MFAMLNYVVEMMTKKSCKYDDSGLLLFLFDVDVFC